MESQNIFLKLLKERPDFILLILLVLIIPFMFLVLIPIAFILRRLNTPRTQLVKEMLSNPAVQARIKDSNFDLSSLMQEMLKIGAQPMENQPLRLGFWAKMNQDITWDVSGIIGSIVTIVLMIMVVSRTYGDMPKEIVAGWTTILGFYFGKATRK
jgi:hypothetical protein